MKKLSFKLAAIAGAILALSAPSISVAATAKAPAKSASITTKKTVAVKKITLPSDAKVIELARQKGAKMTTRGIVQPKTVLKKEDKGQMRVPITLSAEEKEIPTGKAEKPAKARGNGGYAFIFIKPQNLAGLGHIGWGYWAPNMNYYVAGSTENNPGWPVLLPGQDNGYWSGAYWDENSMFAKMKSMGYYAYKKQWVNSPNYNAAWGRACYTRDNGFRGVGWNCLDHTYYILEGYGVTGMPWKQTNPAPTGWFNAFPGTAYRLP